METVPSISLYNAKEALDFYKENLSATIEQVLYYKDTPGYENSLFKDKIIHSRVVIGDSVFYMHDQQDDSVQKIGRNVQFCLNTFNETEFISLYEKLKVSSILERDIEEAHFSAKSFSILDPFDIVWHIFLISEVAK